jgi:GDP-L-fucose synthase
MDKINDGGAINLSTGIYTSFIDFARLTAGLLDFKPEVTGQSDKPAGVFARGGDTAKQKQLGFQYKLSFKDGIKKALEYYARKA